MKKKVSNDLLLWGIVFSLLLFGAGSGTAAECKEDVVAVGLGNDIVITTSEVKAVQTYFTDNTIYRLTEKGYVKQTVKAVLFSEEAKKRGIEINPSGYDNEEESSSIPDWLVLAGKYAEMVLNSHEIPEISLKSYFYAHPEKYGHYAERYEDLGDDQRKEIRDIFVRVKKERILDAELDSLIQKYGITFCQ